MTLNNHFERIDWSSKFLDHDYNVFVHTVSSAIDTYIPKTAKTAKTKAALVVKKDYQLLFVTRKG